MSSNSDAEISDYEDEAQTRKRSRPSESDEVHCMASACILAGTVQSEIFALETGACTQKHKFLQLVC